MQDQQAVTVITQERRAFDGAREVERLLKPAVRDFELMIGDAFTEKSVTTTTRNAQRPILDYDFEFIGAHAREVYFHNPSIRSAINVRVWPPRARAGPHTP
jgi:hypothetical protein